MVLVLVYGQEPFGVYEWIGSSQLIDIIVKCKIWSKMMAFDNVVKKKNSTIKLWQKLKYNQPKMIRMHSF